VHGLEKSADFDALALQSMEVGTYWVPKQVWAAAPDADPANAIKLNATALISVRIAISL
jgi:hypothetical protein